LIDVAAKQSERHFGTKSSGSTGVRRCFLLQHGLRGRFSHYLSETEGWHAALPRHGMQPLILVHKNCPPEIACRFGARPIFGLAPDSTISAPDTYEGLRTFIEGSAMIALGCHTIDADSPNPDDIVVLPYANDVEILGLAKWAERRRLARALPFAVVIVHRPDFRWVWDDGSSRLTGDVAQMAYALFRLREAFGDAGHLVMTTNTPLAHALASIAGQPVVAGCAPMSYSAGDSCAAPQGDRFDAAFVGQMRPEKGSRMLAAIVTDYLAKRPAGRVAIHLDDPANGEAYLNDLPLLRGLPGLTWFEGPLSRDDYGALLARSNCIVLPFEPSRYTMRISGVFADAVAAGTPVIVPAGTWMAGMLAAGRGGGLTALRHHPVVYAHAIVRLNERLQEMQENAATARTRWRREQSIDRLVEIMMEHVPQGGR